MKVFEYPARADWKKLLERPYTNNAAVIESVKKIIDDVKLKGDSAVRSFTEQFNKTVLTSFDVNEEELNGAAYHISEELKAAIVQAKQNIEKFHLSQLKNEEAVETMPGVTCWRRSVGIQKVGLYIPGGSAPLFSTLLMLGIPAKIAHCKEIYLFSPADKNGNLHPAILFTAHILGLFKVYKIGGAQAIAAMAYGTESIAKVDKIFGPGNQYVTAAKQIVAMEGTAIDMPAGPSEVMVVADETAFPAYIAADLLSQAEHGADSQVVLVSTSKQIIDETLFEIQRQLQQLPRKEIALKALENSKAILVQSIKEAIDVANEYAPEHLILSCLDDEEVAENVVNAGSVFLGNYSPESVGDYASGTNHTLPTNGYARAYSGVSVDSFVKKITYQKLTKAGLENIGKTVTTMAEAEGLDAHANAVAIRLRDFSVFHSQLQTPNP